MSFFMGFNRINRVQSKMQQEAEKLIKGEPSLSHGKVFVHRSVIIVEMDFSKISPQGLQPDGKRGLAEDIVMPRIETESKMG